MPPGESGPAAVESIAVTREDLVAAYEHALRGGEGRAVLRLTPPFHARMRARIHMEAGSGQEGDAGRDPPDADAGEPAPIHLPPERLIDAGRAPDPPTPDETEDALRADPEAEYGVERHRERHAAAMDRWRAAVGAAARDRVEIETPAGSKTVEVTVLGADEGGSGSGPGSESESGPESGAEPGGDGP